MTMNASNGNFTPTNSDNIYVFKLISGTILLTKLFEIMNGAFMLNEPFELLSERTSEGIQLYLKPYMAYTDINAVILQTSGVESYVIAGESVGSIYVKYVKRFKSGVSLDDTLSTDSETELKSERTSNTKLH